MFLLSDKPVQFDSERRSEPHASQTMPSRLPKRFLALPLHANPEQRDGLFLVRSVHSRPFPSPSDKSLRPASIPSDLSPPSRSERRANPIRLTPERQTMPHAVPFPSDEPHHSTSGSFANETAGKNRGEDETSKTDRAHVKGSACEHSVPGC